MIALKGRSYANRKVNILKLTVTSFIITNLKVHFCNPNMLFYRQNKLVSKFSVDSEVAFVSYAWFTVDIINRQFGRLFRQINKFARNICTQTLCTQRLLLNVKISTFLGGKWGWGCGSRNISLFCIDGNQSTKQST